MTVNGSTGLTERISVQSENSSEAEGGICSEQNHDCGCILTREELSGRK